MPKLIPLRDYVLIRHDPEPESLVVRPDKASKDYTPTVATVVAVGDIVNVRGMDESKACHPTFSVMAGDRVLVEGGRHGGTPIEVEGDERLVIIRDKMVMAVIR